MARTVLVDSGFLVALLSRNDQWHDWAVAQTQQAPRPWVTCDAVLSETFHLLGQTGMRSLSEVIRRGGLSFPLDLGPDFGPILGLMDKYANVPMSLADACLVRLTETFADPLLLTTDTDFRVYRRHSRQVIPCLMP
jgi:uncharacterized protein